MIPHLAVCPQRVPRGNATLSLSSLRRCLMNRVSKKLGRLLREHRDPAWEAEKRIAHGALAESSMSGGGQADHG